MKKLVIVYTGFALIIANMAFAQNKNDTKKKENASEAVVLTITTVSLAEKTGCWARIHDGYNFTGRTLTLVGGQSLPTLEFPAGNDWEGDIDSLVVGPKAKVTVYEDENYRDKMQEIKSNEKISDLHKSFASEGVESMKIACL